uniref:Uncharacterized protein n=1 Tax=Hyaloperonospora arabidopsidis (strain Emoy2) TaxID=559515 RepID=M4C4U0_HYAAE
MHRRRAEATTYKRCLLNTTLDSAWCKGALPAGFEPATYRSCKRVTIVTYARDYCDVRT